jgi:hypothetical protein
MASAARLAELAARAQLPGGGPGLKLSSKSGSNKAEAEASPLVNLPTFCCCGAAVATRLAIASKQPTIPFVRQHS